MPKTELMAQTAYGNAMSIDRVLSQKTNQRRNVKTRDHYAT